MKKIRVENFKVIILHSRGYISKIIHCEKVSHLFITLHTPTPFGHQTPQLTSINFLVHFVSLSVRQVRNFPAQEPPAQPSHQQRLNLQMPLPLHPQHSGAGRHVC